MSHEWPTAKAISKSFAPACSELEADASTGCPLSHTAGTTRVADKSHLPRGGRVDSAAKQVDTWTAVHRCAFHVEPLGDLRIDWLDLCSLTSRPSPVLLDELLGALGLQVDCGAWDGAENAEPALGIGVVVAGAGLTCRKDSDQDGMPDAWEEVHGLNPNDLRPVARFSRSDRSLESSLAGRRRSISPTQVEARS